MLLVAALSYHVAIHATGFAIDQPFMGSQDTPAGSPASGMRNADTSVLNPVGVFVCAVTQTPFFSNVAILSKDHAEPRREISAGSPAACSWCAAICARKYAITGLAGNSFMSAMTFAERKSAVATVARRPATKVPALAFARDAKKKHLLQIM